MHPFRVSRSRGRARTRALHSALPANMNSPRAARSAARGLPHCSVLDAAPAVTGPSIIIIYVDIIQISVVITKVYYVYNSELGRPARPGSHYDYSHSHRESDVDE